MAPKAQKQYKIVQLEAENIKRLKAVSITPEGNIIEITGNNGQGKTSLLDSIYWALTGKSKKTQKNPIHGQEEKAKIKLDLGSLVIYRTFSRKEDGDYTTGLIVESEDGARFQKPQDILDQITNELSFDPLEFTRMKPDAQFEHLKRFVPNFDFNADANARKADFDKRTDVKRRLSDLRAQADAIVVADDTPDDEIDVTAISDEIAAAMEHNAEIDRRTGNRERVAEQIKAHNKTADNLRDRIEVMRTQIKALELEVEQVDALAAELADKLEKAAPLAKPIDPAPLRAKIAESSVVNNAVREKKRKTEMLEQIEKLDCEVKDLTKALSDRDDAKAKVISSAEMPVPGLGFGEDYVTLNEQPFDQASMAEQLRASVALTIASNPRLRIILIRDGSLLDSKSWTMLTDLADESDIQIWVETVSSGRPAAIVIEDGAIVAQAAE